jgi:hypothetical protein
MGANPTQALALLIFMIGFTVGAAGFGLMGSVVVGIIGVALAGGSIVLFQKCKPWEQKED